MDWVFFPSDWALSGMDLCDLLGDSDLFITPVLFHCHSWTSMVLTGESNFEPTRPSGD